MSAGHRFIRYWLPVMVWMTLIFAASTDAMSSRQTSRLIGPMLRWLFPGIAAATEDQIVFTIRKSAHVTEYAVLALLLWRARRQPVKKDPRPWAWAEAVWAFAVVALYAVTDEFHQYFVASRGASVADVLLDSFGAALGLLVLWLSGHWLKRR